MTDTATESKIGALVIAFAKFAGDALMRGIIYAATVIGGVRISSTEVSSATPPASQTQIIELQNQFNQLNEIVRRLNEDSLRR